MRFRLSEEARQQFNHELRCLMEPDGHETWEGLREGLLDGTILVVAVDTHTGSLLLQTPDYPAGPATDRPPKSRTTPR